MSNAFDSLVNGHNIGLQFDEYEKSYFTTLAQETFVISCYDGKNQSGYQFEVTEEDRRTLDSLIVTTGVTQDVQTHVHIVEESKFYKLPQNVLFITYENATLYGNTTGCTSSAVIVPVTQDEFWKTYNNPFRGPNKNRVLRLDAGEDLVELVPSNTIKDYTIRYIKKPEPILFVDMPENTDLTMFGGRTTKSTKCELDESVHNRIVEIAVGMALRSNNIKNQ